MMGLAPSQLSKVLFKAFLASGAAPSLRGGGGGRDGGGGGGKSGGATDGRSVFGPFYRSSQPFRPM
jgi:hypothetical protein